MQLISHINCTLLISEYINWRHCNYVYEHRRLHFFGAYQQTVWPFLFWQGFTFTDLTLRPWTPKLYILEYGVHQVYQGRRATSTKGRFIYILDSSNSSSITFWTSQFSSSSISNWTGIWNGNSNGSWTDKQSSHFNTVKEINVKATFFFM